MLRTMVCVLLAVPVLEESTQAAWDAKADNRVPLAVLQLLTFGMFSREKSCTDRLPSTSLFFSQSFNYVKQIRKRNLKDKWDPVIWGLSTW